MPPPAVRTRLPGAVLLGIVSLGVAMVFMACSFVWEYFGIRMLRTPADLAGYFQVEFGLSGAQILFLDLGIFLIFRGILRALPRIDSWAWVGPVLILVGGVVAAGADVVQMAFAPLIYPPANGAAMADLLNAVYAVLIGGSVAGTAGDFLALVATARGVFARLGERPPPPADTLGGGLPLSGDPGKGV